ncbi:MAG: DNA recombination protein RmuC [Bdellovibrionota bacterium]
MQIQTVLIITLLLATTACLLLQIFWLKRGPRHVELDFIQKALLDLNDKSTRHTMEIRDVLTERLGKHSLDSQERVDRTLFKHFETVQQHLKSAELKLASLNTVGQSISDLNNLLKLPHLRGGFGEATLERLLADFLPAGSYELQYQVVPTSPERVDAAVRLARKMLPIDSKFPRDQVLPLLEQQDDPAEIASARKALADFTKAQARSIAAKYIRPDHGTTEMALLFLPSETLYFEIIRNGEVFEAISKLKVFPVSPNTLAISLHSIAMAQEYYEMARGVEKTIEDVRKARRHFEQFDKKFDEVGRGLKKAQEAFETAHSHLGHYENSVLRLMGERSADSDAGAGTSIPSAQDASIALQTDKPGSDMLS